MPKQDQSSLSVIIVNHNGSKYVEKCVESILKSNTHKYEIIVVDNGSKSTERAKLNGLPDMNRTIKVLYLHKNFGPALARNIGVKNSSGDFIAFLDNDTVVDQNWAKNAIKYFAENKKVGIIQCKLLLESDHSKIDYVGEYLGSNGFLVQECSAGTIDDGRYDKSKPILAAKSAGMFIRRVAFDKAGGFDDSYFIYVEETDLGWRNWLVGYEAHYLPNSIVYHHFGTSTIILGESVASNLAKFHGPKNYLTTLYKNLPNRLLTKTILIHFFLWLGLIFYRLITLHFLDSYFMSKGIIFFFVHINEIHKKRNEIQSKKNFSDEYFMKKLVVERPLWYFINKAVVVRGVGNAKSY